MWRRKIGVVTLMMALVAMGGWVRSFYVVDISCIYSTEEDCNSFASGCGGLLYFVVDDFVGFGSPPSGFWDSRLISPDDPFEPLRYVDTKSGFWGFECGKRELGNGGFVSIIRIPYWSVVFPLTVISAFLLLSKPPKSNQKKTSEPIENDGA